MNGSPEFRLGDGPAPILVLGLGNILLSDDGVGPALLEQLAQHAHRWEGQVEFLDGGTQGLALLGHLSGRRALIILDAVRQNEPPGTVHILTLAELRKFASARASSGHEGNAGELLAAAELLDELPPRLFVIGVEPESLVTAIGLSSAVQEALPLAAKYALRLLDELSSTEASCSAALEPPPKVTVAAAN